MAQRAESKDAAEPQPQQARVLSKRMLADSRYAAFWPGALRMLVPSLFALADQAEARRRCSAAKIFPVLAAFEDVRVALLRARERVWDDCF